MIFLLSIYFILFYFILFHFISFHFTFYFIIFYFIIFYSDLFIGCEKELFEALAKLQSVADGLSVTPAEVYLLLSSPSQLLSLSTIIPSYHLHFFVFYIYLYIFVLI